MSLQDDVSCNTETVRQSQTAKTGNHLDGVKFKELSENFIPYLILYCRVHTADAITEVEQQQG